jgi:hypothetical protein
MQPMILMPADESTAQAVDDIIYLNKRIYCQWFDGGYAPMDAARLLQRAGLDRLVSLSHTLRLWLDPGPEPESQGRLILAWANLGTLLEGGMKWFLCVWEHCYAYHRVTTLEGCELGPDELWFLKLCQFFREHVWVPEQVDKWHSWCDKIRRRRNAIHAYEKRDLGTWAEFYLDVRRLRDLLQELEMGIPEPPSEPRWSD